MYENLYTQQPEARAPETAHHGTTLNRPGGVVEYRVGSQSGPSNEGRVSSPAIQANMGAVLTSGPNGTISQGGVTTFNATEFTAGQEDYLATARNGFFPARGNLTPDSIVKFGGLEATLGTLEQMGEVRRNANGSYEIVGGKSNQVAGAASDEAPKAAESLPEGVQAFPEEVESAFAEAIDPFPQNVYDNSISRALEGGLDALNFAEIGGQSGMTSSEARERAEFVVQAFSHQADAIAKAQGVDPQEVWAWAADEQAGKLADAQRRLVMGRDTSGLRSLVADYLKSVPPTVEALRNGGFEVRIDAQGQSTFKLGNVWMTPEAAARSGMI